MDYWRSTGEKLSLKSRIQEGSTSAPPPTPVREPAPPTQQGGTEVPSPTPPTTITKRGGEDIPAPSPTRSSLVNTEGAQMEQFAREPRVEEWIEDKSLEDTPPPPLTFTFPIGQP